MKSLFSFFIQISNTPLTYFFCFALWSKPYGKAKQTRGETSALQKAKAQEKLFFVFW